MTCVVGLVDGGKIWMGGDSASMNDRMDLIVMRTPKVFQKRDMLLGLSGPCLAGTLLRYKLNLMPHKDPGSPFLKGSAFKDGRETEWMNTVFVDAWRECLIAGGCHERGKQTENHPVYVLVGWRGKLYRVGSDFHVLEAAAPYDAIGCGANFALGSLFTSTSKSPRSRITTALKAAEAMSAGVRPPFKIISMAVKK